MRACVCDMLMCSCCAGKAVDVLQVLSKLPQLRQIDLSYQYLYGTLPANISFASLAILTLATTYLTVGMASLFVCMTLCLPCK